MTAVKVIEVAENLLAITFPYDAMLVERVKGMPQRKWNKSEKRWEFRPTLANIQYLDHWFEGATWDKKAERYVNEALDRKAKRDETAKTKVHGAFDFSLLEGVPFKMPPLEHQKRALILGRDMPYFAYLMDQGTGKTKVVIDDAAHNFREGRINALLVIAPNSVKSNWVDPGDTYSQTQDPGDMDEITKHMAPDIEFNKGCWVSGSTKKERDIYAKFKKNWEKPNTLHILVVNVEALQQYDKKKKPNDKAYNEMIAFIHDHDVMIVCDESTRIKNRSAKRTRNAISLRDHCKIARIMSGTPLIKSPLDAFAQFRFLDEDILGFSNYYSFQHHFAVMGGYEGYQVLFYKNLEELSEKIDSVSFRVLKKDCLDLPPQIYLKRHVELSRRQAEAYTAMADEMEVYLESLEDDDGETITADIILTQMLRLQQITGGYLPKVDDAGDTIGHHAIVAPENNPKFKEAMSIIDESGDQKVIIWCRFRDEIEGLASLLKKRDNEFGFLEFHGGISTQQRRENRKLFASDPRYKVMIGNQDSGGIGIDEFKIASIVIYLSNSFNTENRVQSEDRTHRIGSEQHEKITYFDIIAERTIDAKVIACLRDNVSISQKIMKDGWREWI